MLGWHLGNCPEQDYRCLHVRTELPVSTCSGYNLCHPGITEKKKTSTFSSANFTEGNIVKNNVTIRSTAKRFIYSMSAYE